MEPTYLSRTVAIFTLCVIAFAHAYGHDAVSGKSPTVDEWLHRAFENLKLKKYREARSDFESAFREFEKKPKPSAWLFDRIKLPDEDGSESSSSDPNIRQITAFRHTMGTRQALVTFMSFSAQLEGDKAAASKYFDQIYSLRNVLWGTSWKTFITPIQGVFHTTVPREESENYGLYLFRAGELLFEVEEEVSLKMLREGQRLVPKDPEIAGSLANYLVVTFNFAEAKKFADLSLSLKPDQKRVLIDLATANWMLGDLAAAERVAVAATKLQPPLPGPHVTLALIHLENGDLKSAAVESEKGVQLSQRHPFYLTVRAASLEAEGKKQEATALMKEAWAEEMPDEATVKKWFLKGKSLALILQVISRSK